MTGRGVVEVLGDASQLDLASVLQDGRVCAWCRRPRLEHPNPARRRDWIYGNKRCRQAAHRFGVDRAQPVDPADDRRRFAYADPPYPGKAALYPEHTEVDHRELIARLADGWPDGWALSTSAGALPQVLALVPAGLDVRVAAWIRPVRRSRSTRALSSWEPVLLAGGRPLPTQRPAGGRGCGHDVHDALVYRGRYRAFPDALVGMKPPQFSEWVFRMLGAQPGDQLDDLYPGSGAVTEAWRRFTLGRARLPPHLRAAG